MKSLNILCGLVFILLGSCSKDESKLQQTSIQGQVRIHGTETPLTNGLPMEITLMEQYNPNDGAPIGSGGGSAYREIETTTTDSLGNFSFSFKGSSSSIFYLEPLSVPDPFSFSDGLSSLLDNYSIQVGVNQTKDIYMYAPGWLAMTFENEGPVYLGDFLRVGLSVGSSGFYTVYGPTQNNSSAQQKFKLGGNTIEKVRFVLSRNNQITEWEDTYSIPAFDTVKVVIKY
tara:strand:+ start:69 stop:755 length:687 start_codon:yes stop_codon:yes gene_type:complete